MRRAEFGLGIALLAAALIALFSSYTSHQFSDSVEPVLANPDPATDSVSPNSEFSEITMDNSGGLLQGVELHSMESNLLTDKDFVLPPQYLDENASNEMVRELITQEIQLEYALLIERLDLSQSEKSTLLAFLTEARIAETTTLYTRGQTIDEQVRLNAISVIVGNSKLKQFLDLEHNRASFVEVQKVQSLLTTKGVPITDTQRDDLLEVLIEIQNQDISMPPTDAKPNSFEYLEYRLSEKIERKRLVMELAASVLSPEQIRYFDERNQHLIMQTTTAIQARKKAIATGATDDDRVWYAVPGE